MFKDKIQQIIKNLFYFLTYNLFTLKIKQIDSKMQDSMYTFATILVNYHSSI